MFDAKTHLSELVRNVQKGEVYTLTNRNQEVAILISVEEYQRTSTKSSYDSLRKIFKNKIFENLIFKNA